MIASILHLPAGTPEADPRLREQLSRMPGLVSYYVLVPGEGVGERLAVLLWESEQDLDAYIDSDLGQQVLRDNPRATRTIYTVEQMK